MVIAGWALSLAVIRDVAPPPAAASRIGYLTMAMAVAPMLGPTVGGALDQLFGWRANFYVFAGLGTAALALCWIDLGETNKTPSQTLAQQVRAYPELFRSRRFWGYALCMAFSTGSSYAFLAGAPLVAVTLLGLSPAALGVGLGNGLTMPSSNAGALSVRPALAGSASGLAGALTVGGGAVLTTIAGVIVTVESGAYALLGMMLICTLAALLAALVVRAIDRREGAGTSPNDV